MKKIFLITAFLVFAFFIFFFQKSDNTNQALNQNKTNRQISVYQKIQVGKTDENYVKYLFPEGITALFILEKTALVEKTGQGNQAYVVSINNQKANAEKKEFWAFYINGKLAPVGAGDYKLKMNDKIEWKIEKF